MLVVGDREQDGGVVAVRRHREGDVGQMSASEFVEKARASILRRE